MMPTAYCIVILYISSGSPYDLTTASTTGIWTTAAIAAMARMMRADAPFIRSSSAASFLPIAVEMLVDMPLATRMEEAPVSKVTG